VKQSTESLIWILKFVIQRSFHELQSVARKHKSTKCYFLVSAKVPANVTKGIFWLIVKYADYIPSSRGASQISTESMSVPPILSGTILAQCASMYIMSRKILITFVGMKDPYPEDETAPGPILSLLKVEQFDEVYLLCSNASFVERAKDLETEVQAEQIAARINIVDFPLQDVISYEEIWKKLDSVLNSIEQSMSSQKNRWSFLLDSGTPQMKSCLFLAGKTQKYRTRLLQGIPPEFGHGTYHVRDITNATPSLPVQSATLTGRHIPESQVFFQGEPTSGYVGNTEVEKDTCREPGLIFEEFVVAQSPALREAFQRARRVAKYSEPVLILGETGTGKTMLARTIHEQSPRCDAPFIELNCSAIPEGLAESTLFGHERGAFTGADRAKSGALRSADRGTLFLDEVGDLPLFVQAKLLKAIEEQRFTPVGADRPVSVDVRIIAATNSDLKARIAQGTFRRDLYQRLNVITITLPPLRDRPEDVEALIKNTLATWNINYQEHKYLSGEAKQLLLHYAWPGNVRELLNAVRSAAAIAPHDEILPEYLPDDIRKAGKLANSMPKTSTCGRSSTDVRPTDFPPVQPQAVDLPPNGIDLRAKLLQIEWEYFSRALRQANGNREAAARLLGLTGHSFRKALKERFATFVESEGWDEE